MTRKLCFLMPSTVKESELFAKPCPKVWQATSMKNFPAHCFSMVINGSQGENYCTPILRYFYWFANFHHTLIIYLGLASFSCSRNRYGHMIILKPWRWCELSIKHLVSGNKSVILFGDPAQLPPVAEKPLYHAIPENSIGEQGYLTYQMFHKVVKLNINQRVQGDNPEQTEFRELLLRLRKGDSKVSDRKLLTQQPTNQKTPGVSYVALSRNKALSSCVIEPMAYEQLTSLKSSKTLQYRLSEDHRLNQLALATYNQFHNSECYHSFFCNPTPV